MTTARRVRAACLALALSAANDLGAQAPTPAGSADGIGAAIADRDFLLEHPLLPKVVSDETAERISGWLDQTAEKLRLEAALSYDALAMGALNDAQEWGAASGDLSLSIRWQVLRRERGLPLTLAARVRERHAIGGRSPTELRRETNALWGYADGFTGAGFEVPEFYFEERLFQERLLLRYGQMAPDDLLDDHRLRSAKRSFLNQAFASSPAVGFPGAGLGWAARWTSPRGWDLTATLSNLESSNVDERADWSLNADALFAGLQLGMDYEGRSGHAGRLQVLLWNGDGLPAEGLTASRGASVTWQQALDRRTRAFLRYAWSDGDLAPAAHLFAAGVAWDRTEFDRLGLAVATGESSRMGGNRQTSLEVFYRHQVNASIVITPDLQMAFGNGLGGGRDWLLLAGLRIGVSF